MTPPSTGHALSKSQVNKAGKLLRKWTKGEDPQPEELVAALTVMLDWRASHQYPLGKASAGLRSMVRSEGCQVEVSQRLKQALTIIDKLERQPTMALTTMQDIGGCRAVLSSISELRRVEKRVKKRRPPLHESDYILNPKDSGYRGVHLIVNYDERMIEIQLRTQSMHEWAINVERFSGRTGYDLKNGRGPTEVLQWLEAISEAMAHEERGEDVPDALVGIITKRRALALPFIEGGREHHG